MAITCGINHIATLTTDMDRTVRFYEDAFEGSVVAEIAPSAEHPAMKTVDIGGATLNIFQVGADDIVGERRRIGRRGAIDHFGLAVDSLPTLEAVKARLAGAGAQEIGDIQPLGAEWSLFFRDPDGMELEVCCPR